MALRVDNFKLYVSRSNGMFIPIHDYNLLILVEGADTGASFVKNLPLSRRMLFAYTPKIQRVFNRMMKPDIKELKKSYGKGVTVLFNQAALAGRSYYYDITPYFRSLKNRLPSVRYAKEGLKFLKNVVNSVKDSNKETILLYYVDDSLLPSKIREKELYAFMFSFHLRKQILDLGINKIFLLTSNSAKLIYDRSLGSKNKFTMFLKWIILSMKRKRIVTVEDDIESLDAEEKQEIGDIVDNKKEIEKELNNDIEHEEEKQEVIEKKKEKTKEKDEPIVDIKKPKQEDAPKRKAPIITQRDVDTASREIIKNTYGDISRLNVSLDTLLSRVVSYAKSSPNVEKEVVKAYVKDDIPAQQQIAKAALTQTDDPELSLIDAKPKKENISKQEETARKLGLTQVLPVDVLHKPDVNSKLAKNNISNAIARRHGYKEQLVSILQRSLPPMLADINYRLLDITFSNMSSNDTELFQTELEFINIKCKDSDNKPVTLKFKIPKLTEDRYVLSGGLKWYYPTVLSTLPIFIVKPFHTQLRTNYSAISFTYGIFNRREDIRCYVGGFKLPMSLLLSCLLSIEGILRTFNFQYMILDKKQKGDNFVNLPLVDGTFLAIQKKTDILSKVIISGLEQMFAKYRPENINTTKEAFEALKQYTKQSKSEYILKRVFQYIVDVQTFDVMKAHGFPTDLPNIIVYCSELAISGEADDKLSIKNTYLRTTDIIIAGIEKGVHNGIAIYNQQKIYAPDKELKVNVGFVINFFRENGVLQMLEQQNPVEEVSGYSSVKIVGPGGLPNRDAVQPKDRAMRRTHFGNLDPVDTSEGDPGIRLFLTTGHVYDDKQHSFLPMDVNENNKNVLGLTGSLTPFVDRDDQARLNMACNQARQTIPIVSSEVPMVMTGTETVIPTMTSSTFTKRAKKDGVVTHIDNNIIVLKYDDGTKEAIDIRPTQLKSGSGIDSAITFEPSVKVGDKVKMNRLLTTNEFLQPVLTQGINVKCAYLSYMGYNYEDGIVLSESLAKKLTSVHYDIIEIDLTERDKLAVFPAIGQEFNKGDTISVVKRNIIGDMSLTEDWEIIAPSKLKVADIAVYPKNVSQVSEILKQIEATYQETNNVLKQQGLPLIFDKSKVIANAGKYKAHEDKLLATKIVIKLLRYMPVSIGDKLTNRHAAKGVVARIVPDDLMPYTEDGERMDILINPLSVVSRMNLGQMYEMMTGKIFYYATKRIAQMLKENKPRKYIEDFMIELYSIMDGTDDKTYSADVAKNLRSIDDNMFKKFIFGIANGKIHYVVPPFQSPKAKDILKAAELVGVTKADTLYVPEINSKTKNPVAWGIMYMQKLEHISEVKQNVRNLGPYIKTTLEPTRGKARAGGQRMGEMDTWCLLSYDAKNVLSDFWLVNADNPDAKKQVLSEIYKSGSADITFDVNRSGAGQLFDSVLLCMGVNPRN